MAFRVNYGMQRAERNRASQTRDERKQKRREEKSAERKAKRTTSASPVEVKV